MTYLIAGAPGAGKSSVGELFSKAGYCTIDTDTYPGLTKWFNKESGLAVTLPSEGVSKEWLSVHDYNWDLAILNELLRFTTRDGAIFYGSSSNQEAVLDLFDKVFLLEVKPATVVQRLKKRTNNAYGNTQEEIEHVLDWYPDFQVRYREHGAVLIDANQPLSRVFVSIESQL